MTQFRDSFYDLVPPWLRTGVGEKYMYTLELLRDLLMEKANQAQRIRMPGQGDPSQIPYLAHDRQLVQGPNEPNLSFVERLKNAFATWDTAGSANAVLGQIAAYAQGFQPGVPAANPALAIVSNPRAITLPSVTVEANAWWTLAQGDAPGTFPTLRLEPDDFNWDGNDAATWRCWLILYQYAVATGQSGASASTTTASGGSFTVSGQNVGGVWVPTTGGTPVNAPFLRITGLSGIDDANVGDLLTLSGSTNPSNNGTFQIVELLSPTSATIANTTGVTGDAGPLAWSIARFNWIPPALAFGTPATVWGDGEAIIPAVDTGSNVQGTWKPTTLAGIGSRPTYSWGVRVDPLDIETIRGLVKAWKSAGTYYPNIIVCYDGGDGLGTSAYSPTNDGAHNPDGTFGSVGKNVGGVWVPTRAITSQFNAFCQGTGQALACGVENVS